ncbi:hypothetical protein TSOC_001511 [Tetrabaena socialis]|uniref:Uncharacterized protein n=1 Tax=Tetrabaena socialis TaxID=47790 RepID=A0A2J8AGL9_9CHLO|nr:hypothetical protein TSOC_001511 [Tetrabaena socialis]|eukprot:PNH11657.1 hypothetical protein TSOC_001511 [Tetrabaena socialis]
METPFKPFKVFLISILCAALVGAATQSRPPARRPRLPPPHSPAPGTPAASVPEVVSVPSDAFPAGADVTRFMADAQDNLYLRGRPQPNNYDGYNDPVAYARWEQASRLGVPVNSTCVLVATYHQLSGNGTFLRTFNDTVEFLFTYSPYRSPLVCVGFENSAAAVDREGQYLYWAAVLRISGAALDLDGSTYSQVLLVKRINLQTGLADTVLRASLTPSWFANNTDDPRAQSYISSGIQGAAVLSTSPPVLALFFGVVGPDVDTVGNFAPVVCQVDVASGAVQVRQVGLGTPVESWAYDDEQTDGDTVLAGRGLYLVYTDSIPTSRAMCNTSPTPSQSFDCYSHFMVRAVSSGSTGLRAEEVLPFEAFLPAGQVFGVSPLTVAVARRPQYPAYSSLYLADAYSCQIKRLDPTGATLLAGYANLASLSSMGGAASVGAMVGLDGDAVSNQGQTGLVHGVRARPICSSYSSDGPSVGRPIGRPIRLVRGSTGTLFFLELIAGQPSVSGVRYSLRRLTGI